MARLDSILWPVDIQRIRLSYFALLITSLCNSVIWKHKNSKHRAVLFYFLMFPGMIIIEIRGFHGPYHSVLFPSVFWVCSTCINMFVIGFLFGSIIGSPLFQSHPDALGYRGLILIVGHHCSAYMQHGCSLVVLLVLNLYLTRLKFGKPHTHTYNAHLHAYQCQCKSADVLKHKCSCTIFHHHQPASSSSLTTINQQHRPPVYLVTLAFLAVTHHEHPQQYPP